MKIALTALIMTGALAGCVAVPYAAEPVVVPAPGYYVAPAPAYFGYRHYGGHRHYYQQPHRHYR